MSDKPIASVVQTFERALGSIRTRVSVCAPAGLQTHAAIAVAYSGGLDSSALLHLARDYAAEHQLQLYAFHVHHGISPNADAWQAHCEHECARLGIAFETRRVSLIDVDKGGVEEAARISRYAALGAMCRAHQVALLLTAHHLDDQAETVLLQLLRGSGVAGLSGMDTVNAAPALLGNAELLVGRPLLSVARSELEAFTASHSIVHVDDESNTDPRYARNALRHQVLPALTQVFPGFQQRFARTAAHAQSAQRLLIELGAQDLSACLDGTCLEIARVRLLSKDRIDNLLRYWFGSRGIRMPSTAWVTQSCASAFASSNWERISSSHADCHIRRYRDRVYITPKFDDEPADFQPIAFRWNGEGQLHFPSLRGTLIFERSEQGLDVDWLRATDLSIRLRSGGERLKPAWNRSTRSLKYHYQALDVPPWERERLPLVMEGNQILFAAGVGMDCHRLAIVSGSHVLLRWEPDTVA